jgi:hypothetical protein
MEDLIGGIQTAASIPVRISLMSVGTVSQRAKVVLRSSIPGRERWYVSALEDRPRLAAAVELVLGKEEGIESAHANPLTGQILIHCKPDLGPEKIEDLIRRAIEFGPMSREEFAALKPKPARSVSIKHLAMAEMACSAVHMGLLGFCPLTLVAAGLVFLIHRRH